MTLSVILVAYKSCDYLPQNLDALNALRSEVEGGIEVIVVDNGSHDGTIDLLARRYPWVRVVGNDANRGFAAACNQGVRMAMGRTFLFLNPDMVVPQGALARALAVLAQRPRVGALTVQLRRADGSLIPTVRRDPGLQDQLLLFLKIPHLFPHLRTIAHYRGEGVNLSESQRVAQCRASFLLVPRAALEAIGLWDERFFLWFEDVDVCRRLREAGYDVWYEASVYATDLYGRSAARVSLWRKQWWFFSSAVKYFWKWGVKRAPDAADFV
jgi:GT2 family glycosyltransferase